MKFIKRLIFVLFLLVVAFFVYRLINPTAAKGLLYDLKSFSNDTIGTNFSLSGEVLETTGVVLDLTGTIVEDTGLSQDISGDEELLLNDMDLPDESFDTKSTGTTVTGTSLVPSTTSSQTSSTTPSKTTTSTPKTTTTTTTTKKTTTSSSNGGLSTQEKRDTESLLDNFGN